MNEQPDKQVIIEFGLKEVKLTEFVLTTEGQISKTADEMYEFQFNFSSNIRPDDKQIDILLNTIIFDKSTPENKIVLGNIKTQFAFFVVNFNELIIKNDNSITINQLLLINCMSIAISTTRGILLISAAASNIKNALIPVMNPAAFLPLTPPSN
jgi:F-box associated protein